MSESNLKFLSDDTVSDLRDRISDNLDRYVNGNFLDRETENGWAIETRTVNVDTDRLSTLDGEARGADAEIANSLIVFDALNGMTPSIAREERVWVRLTHIECLSYSRDRWLAGSNPGKLEPDIARHFFARTRTGMRDDNAIARLWWNAWISRIACPASPERALSQILKSADIRSNIIERTETSSRPPLAQGIVRAMETHQWITDTEANFRDFMKVLNRDGGGILFESLGTGYVDDFLESCAERAKELSGP